MEKDYNKEIKKIFNNSYKNPEEVKRIKEAAKKLNIIDIQYKIKQLKKQSAKLQNLMSKLLIGVATSGLSPFISEPLAKLYLDVVTPVCAILEIEPQKIQKNDLVYLDYLYVMAMMIEYLETLNKYNVNFFLDRESSKA